MLSENLILELVIFIIVCIVLCVAIYYKSSLLNYFVKFGLKGGAENKETTDDMINRIKRSGSIESFVSEAVSESVSSVVSSVISSVKSK